jgi:iron complex transport system ATP-binding protein
VSDVPLLRFEKVRFGYPQGPLFFGPMDVAHHAGQMLAIVGPNGSGKSTFLRLAAGLLPPNEGAVYLADSSIRRLSRRRLALRVAFVPQRIEAPPDLTVRETVMMGRYPHSRFGFLDSIEDFRIAERCMSATNTLPFADRALRTISAGEQQRVHLAAAAAQMPELLILDEPTSALDPYYQISIFGLLRRMCVRDGMAVVVATHDLNLAGQFADAMLLLEHGRVAAAGAPDDVLCNDVLERVYGIAFRTLSSDFGRRCWVVPVPIPDPSMP